MSKNAARPWGFTLVELLTVIAIIAVLATLLSATLASAQRKSRKAVSTSNLRQIAIAFTLYLDDRDKRPETFRQLTDNKYLSERLLLCPEDRIVKNWAGVLESQDLARKSSTSVLFPGREGPSAPAGDAPLADVPHSYFKSFDYIDDVWNQIDKNAMGGLAACQLHGIGRQRSDQPPSLQDYQGLVLRALKDGSVLNRQVFWDTADGTINFGGASAPATSQPDAPGTSQLPLFLDPAQ